MNELFGSPMPILALGYATAFVAQRIFVRLAPQALRALPVSADWWNFFLCHQKFFSWSSIKIKQLIIYIY